MQQTGATVEQQYPGYTYGYQPQQPLQQQQSQYQLQQQSNYQLQQQQPYVAPYENKQPASKICNPCCCCKGGSCNLRRISNYIGAILIIVGVLELYHGYTNAPWFFLPDCKVKYGGSSSQATCESSRTLIIAMHVLTTLIGLSWILAGVFMLLAVSKRNAWAALTAGILVVVGSILLLISYPLTLIAWNNWIDLERGSTHWPPWLPLLIAILFLLVDLVVAGLHVWMAVCCIQFMKQIKAGVDMDTPFGPVVVPQGTPGPPPPTYSYQAMATPSYTGSTFNASSSQAVQS